MNKNKIKGAILLLLIFPLALSVIGYFDKNLSLIWGLSIGLFIDLICILMFFGIDYLTRD